MAGGLRRLIFGGMSRPEDHERPPGFAGTDAPPTLLPQNLAASLQHLSEQDLIRLRDAVAAEIQRRGLGEPKQRERGAGKDKPDPVLSELTRSQISLIRSSINPHYSQARSLSGVVAPDRVDLAVR